MIEKLKTYALPITIFALAALVWGGVGYLLLNNSSIKQSPSIEPTIYSTKMNLPAQLTAVQGKIIDKSEVVAFSEEQDQKLANLTIGELGDLKTESQFTIALNDFSTFSISPDKVETAIVGCQNTETTLSGKEIAFEEIKLDSNIVMCLQDGTPRMLYLIK